jgi:hypothetical protein
MEEYKCAFSAPLIAGEFGCACAKPITRRTGPDVACVSAESHARCGELFQRLKDAALPAFGVEDDLLSMPHSVLQKIQYGGLLGLQRLLQRGESVVRDVDALVGDVLARYSKLDAVPCGDIVGDMTGYKLRGRRRG